MNKHPDTYFTDGCGRCHLGGTPQCKVNRWQNELLLLRNILQDCNLTEVAKWGVPCYMFNNKNVLILGAFKDYAMISFLKGSLMSDPNKILVKAGENSHEGRLIKFTDVQTIENLKPTIKAYVFEAIEIEKAGLQVPKPKQRELMPEELLKYFEENPQVKEAFETLTPGRQRGYLIYFNGAKQSSTRLNRIRVYAPKILMGKGFHD